MNVIVDTPLVPMIDGVNALLIVVGASVENVADAAITLAPPLVVVSAPAGTVLVKVPATDVTLTVTVQEPLAGICPPVSATDVPFDAAATAPPEQVVAPDGVPVFVSPDG